ncbi:MCE family protein [Nocardioides sp. NPDC057767]|uniref:Phospholipid/cholesterol/gamma-HCH transport system substrate-binding protein n=2 Tax=Nocardioides TaxID=1839 RepID=A0A543ACY4_9ACTN|nr:MULTISPECIES: MlaD family protein [Nocardioides]EGD41030.1 virulence factor Mce family protein [Nocardioidaceae bacterium Broad-1]MBC7277376.1 MCE family protein [Nocardioides sp.]NYI80936.1 phospholipid/cholesterol/gamma-HCH transport system substrate-binding protein [Nocardioides panzhihuensis]TQL70400.1 phospholipid/cholesterol/gamma-HCH transport system substrate-binding protein [Nocardioides albertanoniae]
MTSNSKLRRRERSDLIKFGIFLVVAALFTYWVGVVTAAHRPGDRVTYDAVFANVSGLQKGDSVRIAGVDVGKVTALAVQRDATVRVSFDVPRDQKLNASTEATVQYRNLIGDRIVQLSRPDPDARPIKAGDTIPISQTRPALDLDLLLNGFKPLFAGLAPAQINAFSGDLIKILQGQSSAISTLVQRAASLTTTLGNRQELIGEVIRNLNTVVGTLDDKRETIQALIDQFSKLLDGLEQQDTQILDAAAQTDRFARDAASLVEAGREDLAADLTQLTKTANGINQEQATLQQVLQKLPNHYAAIQNTASYGNYFNFFLCGVRIQTEATITTPWIMSDTQRCKR